MLFRHRPTTLHLYDQKNYYSSEFCVYQQLNGLNTDALEAYYCYEKTMETPTFNKALDVNHENAIREVGSDFVAKHWINGKSAAATDERKFNTIDPAIANPITPVARGDSDDINTAVKAARSAFSHEWRQATPQERSKQIHNWTDKLRDYIDELSLLESLDTGKPLSNARNELIEALDQFEYYAAVAQAHEGTHIPKGVDNHVYTRNEPFGVTGQILPWNYPLSLFSWKTGASLAAGNTVVCKPSEEAPLSITRAAQLSKGVLPDGVLNVVNGYGEEAGAALTDHPDVDKLSFTGSVPVGREVMAAGADHITPVTLELGGKSPYVVFPDADLEQAAKTSAAGIFFNTGQSCDACSRIIVHEDIHDEFVDKFIQAANTWEPGDPLTEETSMGPLTFEAQHEKVSDYIDVGINEGADLILGGDGNVHNEDGFYFEPTVFDEVSSEMRIAQEEIFGPVQCILTFSNYDEAIELANDVEYGLASGVATQDASTAHRAAADIEAGSVWINEYHGGGVGIPFGGYKSSGIGRECGKETINEYTRTKSINISLDEPFY